MRWNAMFVPIVVVAALYGCGQPTVSPTQTTTPPAAVTPLAPAPAPTSTSAKLLFRSGFEGATALLPPSDFYGNGAWQNIVGLDSISGFTWPLTIWGGGTTRLFMFPDATVDATTIGNYMVNQIQTVTGHDGNPTQALYQQMSQSGVSGTGPNGDPAQDGLYLQPISETSDLYVSYWLKYQPDLMQKMNPNWLANGTTTPNWRVLFEWKTSSDYRVIVSAVTWGLDTSGVNPPLSWEIIGDNAAANLPYQRFWDVYNTTVPVPVGAWFKFEVFWHRSSGNDGRVWMAVNGQPIVDHSGPNIGVNNAPIDRIMMPNLYSSTSYPIYQWVDDVQIWDSFPPDAAPH